MQCSTTLGWAGLGQASKQTSKELSEETDTQPFQSSNQACKAQQSRETAVQPTSRETKPFIRLHSTSYFVMHCTATLCYSSKRQASKELNNNRTERQRV